MITLKDIAEEANVSKTAVSLVLNNQAAKNRISASTRKRVLAVAKSLKYQRNELATAVKTGKSKVIAFVSLDTGSWEYTGRIMAGIVEELSRQDFSLKVYHLGHISADRIAEQIIAQRVAGVIFHAPLNDDFLLINNEMRKNNIPCATANLSSRETLFGVTSDDFQGAKDAVKHLVELGHERIVHISHQHRGAVPEYVKQRCEGYIAGMRECLGEKTVPRIEFALVAPLASRPVAKKVLSVTAALRPTAIFCVSDAVAMEALQAASLLGIKTPEDLSVVGFANLEMAKYAQPPLTTVAQPFEAMGMETATRLLEIISNKKTIIPENRKNIKLKTKLIVRESTGLIKN